jgi:D-amino-acid dehydrogenase
MNERADVIVVGGGVIGLACANALLDAGRSVRIVEQETVGSGASHGNCGLITPSHALPLNRPGMVRKALRWMWRADSPILVRPRLDFEFLAWGLRFARNCRVDRMRATMRGRAQLLETSRDLYVELIDKEGLACEWETLGLLEIFATGKAREAAEPTSRLLEEHGIRAEPVEAEKLLEFEPALRDGLAGGRWFPRDAQVRPEQLVSELARIVRAKGARIDEGCAVRSLNELRARNVVLATGARAPELCRVPIQPGKGYSVTAARPDPCPKLPLLLHESNMGITPWRSGYRLAGTMEFAGFDDRLRRPRLDALHAGARRYLRHGPVEATEEWCGWRPMTPDELPIIDRLPRHPNVLCALGHGMMGVSMAPATARLITDMVVGAEPFVDPAPYSLARLT